MLTGCLAAHKVATWQRCHQSCAADLQAVLKDVASVEPAFLATAEKQAALVALTEVRSQLDAVTARLLAASDDVGEVHGLRDAAAWLAVQTRATRREARATSRWGGLSTPPPGPRLPLRDDDPLRQQGDLRASDAGRS